jgi:hypothetical protein
VVKEGRLRITSSTTSNATFGHLGICHVEYLRLLQKWLCNLPDRSTHSCGKEVGDLCDRRVRVQPAQPAEACIDAEAPHEASMEGRSALHSRARTIWVYVIFSTRKRGTGGGENQNQTTETRRKPEETRRTRRIDRAAGGVGRGGLAVGETNQRGESDRTMTDRMQVREPPVPVPMRDRE